MIISIFQIMRFFLVNDLLNFTPEVSACLSRIMPNIFKEIKVDLAFKLFSMEIFIIKNGYSC